MCKGTICVTLAPDHPTKPHLWFRICLQCSDFVLLSSDYGQESLSNYQTIVTVQCNIQIIIPNMDCKKKPLDCEVINYNVGADAFILCIEA